MTTTTPFIYNLHAPSLPTLSFELIEEILCRLPVKLFLQLRYISKSQKSLISNPNFAKKHIRLSTTRHIHTLSFSNLSHKFVLTSYRLHSVFTNVTANATRLEYPPNNYDEQNPRNNYIIQLALVTTSFVLLANIKIAFYCGTLPLENSRNCPLIKGHKLLLWLI